MFNFIVKYFGFLKHVPILPHLYDAWMRIGMIFYNRRVLDYLDEIEAEVLSWKETSVSIHKFGGIQFNADKKEIGHIHGNGLLDILFNKEIKMELIKGGRVQEHHIFKNSGWISFYIRNASDKELATELLRRSYGKIAMISNVLLLVSILATSLPSTAQTIVVPDWALPGSATHKQISPPEDFHRVTKTSNIPIGIFEGQSDVGAALVEGSSSYDPATKQYSITSAGYNVWYVRDEFRYLWKKMSGDVSLAADISYPDSLGFGDRKAVLVIRQGLDDDSKEALVALHGAGMMHLAWRPEKGQRIKDMEYRIGSRGALPGGNSPDALVIAHAKRIGIEKRGDMFALFVSMNGEPMHQFGAPIQLKLDGPFYVGIGFCSHLPDKVDTAVLSNVVLANKAGEVH